MTSAPMLAPRAALDGTAMTPLRILALEPYDGGSHRRFLRGLSERSRHDFTVWGMTPRKWKWRMRGSAIHFAERDAREAPEADVLFASDFLDLATFLGLRPDWARKPRLVYFHENQLTYPLQDESLRDYHYAFTNITTALAADRVLFNSEFHRAEFLRAVPDFLRRMPDYRPEGVADRIAERSGVLHPGVDLEALDRARGRRRGRREGDALVLWSHRWEYDKAPGPFFRALFRLAEEGLPFRVCVLGERFRDSPAVFDEARERLGRRIVHFGYAESRGEYEDWLARSDVFVSTAVHEFFGLAAVEAMAAGACPLLPDRLAYPELLPEARRREFLYDDGEFLERLRRRILDVEASRQADLRESMTRFGWEACAARFDAAAGASG